MRYFIQIAVDDDNQVEIKYNEDEYLYTEEDIDGLNINFKKNYLGEGKLNIAVSLPNEEVNKT